jgi:hypothetical protein
MKACPWQPLGVEELTHNEIFTSFIAVSESEVRSTDKGPESAVRLNSVDEEIGVSAENAPK